MGSMIEINDTLQITKEQGFPVELDLDRHLEDPFTLDDVAGKVFSFRAKPSIRVYQQPPVRNFLVENRDGKWIYWGQCFILEIVHDYEKQETSGKFTVVGVNTPKQMKQAFGFLDRNPERDYFEN